MAKKAKKSEVEKLSPEDAEEIENLHKLVWPKAKDYPKKWRKRRMIEREQIIEEMEKGYYYFGIRRDNQIVGVYKASIRDDTVFGEHQAVHPDYRKKGLGSAMYKQIIEFAMEKGCDKVEVNILTKHVPSKRCAQKLGFHKKGEPYEQIEGMKVQKYEKKV